MRKESFLAQMKTGLLLITYAFLSVSKKIMKAKFEC
jgi:hypothetical protein